MNKETIVAPATVMSESGIGIIRLSGDDAVQIVDKFFPKIKEMKSHTIHHGFIMEEDEAVDEVMVSLMKAPNSYTKEDVVEINCHGSIMAMNRIMDLMVKNGARLAEPGEFTKRAFLNGRIDLAEAEAVMDIIQSKSEFALKSSIRQLTGKVSDMIHSLREDILYQVAFIESALDDPEHISLDGYTDILRDKVHDILDKMNLLIKSSENGKILKEGIHTVIIGKPNVGKSSFLNLMVGDDRAIVTDIAGTTRDILEESVKINGIVLHIIDTAGIHPTQDTIEKIGVEKAIKHALDADLIVYIIDASVDLDENDRLIQELIKGKKVIVLLNKTDLESKVDENQLQVFLEGHEASESGNLNGNAGKEKGDNNYPQVDNCVDEITSKETLIKSVFPQTLRGMRADLQRKQALCAANPARETLNQRFPKINKPVLIKVSAKENTGFELFGQAIMDMFVDGGLPMKDEIFITNIRHREALQNAYDSMLLVNQSLEEKMPEDFFTIDLMSAYEYLGLITGEQAGEDLIDEIFSKFCTGK